MVKTNIDNLLKTEVEQVFGQKITDKYSCELLSNQIQKEIKQNISYQTIRRFWKLIKENHSISPQSKNILCKYVGFKDLEGFNEYIENKSQNSSNNHWNIIKDWYTINEQDEPLANNRYWDSKLSQSFAQFILTDEAIFESFCKAMYTNEVAMKYIISYHPVYDNLGKDWYFRGLNLFVRNAQETHYKLFEKTLLFMKTVFTCQEQNLEQLKNEIESLAIEVRQKYGVIWALEARVFGCLLYYYKSVNDENQFFKVKTACFQLLKRHKHHKFEIDSNEIFIFLLVDYCNVWNMPEISKYLLENYPLQFSENALWRNGYNNAMPIVKAMTLFLNGEISKAEKLFENIHLQNINFEFRKYFTIQYLLLSLGLISKNVTQKRAKIKANIDELIKETELVYFERFL